MENAKRMTGYFTAACVAILILFGFFAGSRIVEEVHAGEYHIVQYPNGSVVAKTNPGYYWQVFGKTTKWPKAVTLNFDRNPDTSVDSEQQNDIDVKEIELRFADGTIAPIEGSLRVELPTSPDKAVELVVKHGYRNIHELVENLVVRRVRVSVNSSATMMSALESSSNRRNDFINLSWDQIQDGLFITESKTVSSTESNGSRRDIKIAVPKMDAEGKHVRQNEAGSLDDLGVKLSNFEIKAFLYPDTLEAQIVEQRNAIMAITVARANAEKATEEAKTKEQEGLSAVMKARYEQEVLKVVATVKAGQEKEVAVISSEKEKEMATIAAQKELEVAELQKKQAEIKATQGLEVARLDRQAAEETAKRIVSLGNAEAEAKKAIFTADGALKDKLAAFVESQTVWANAYSLRRVPSMVMGGSGQNSDSDAFDLQTAIAVKIMNDLNLDLGINGQTESNTVTLK